MIAYSHVFVLTNSISGEKEALEDEFEEPDYDLEGKYPVEEE